MTSPLRVGIIGFGLAGRVFHAPFVAADPSFELTLIATSSAARAAEARRLHPDAAVVATPADLLARAGELDLVVLASPAHVHVEQGLAALAAGAAVVVDKPFAPSVADAERLIAAARDAGRLLAVFHNRRWDGDFRTVRKLVGSQALGTVFRFESTFERWGAPVGQRWQDTTTIAQGAGITFDLGSHLIDQALQLFGPARLVQAELTRVRQGGVSDDDAFLDLEHDSGVRSHLTMSRVAGQTGPRFRVLGSASAYSVQGLDNQEAALAAGAVPGSAGFGRTPEAEWGSIGTGDELSPVPTEPGDYPAFYAAVADSIRTGAPFPVDPADALAVVRIIEDAHRRSPIG